MIFKWVVLLKMNQIYINEITSTASKEFRNFAILRSRPIQYKGCIPVDWTYVREVTSRSARVFVMCLYFTLIKYNIRDTLP